MGKNNNVELLGEISSELRYYFKSNEQTFYRSTIKIERNSGNFDEIPFVVSGRIYKDECCIGQSVKIKGEYRSRFKNGHVLLYVLAEEFEPVSKALCFVSAEEFAQGFVVGSKNKIFLDGYICKNPIYRKTPLGKEITDIILAVNRDDGKSDYIPCIAWHRNARITGNLPVGVHIKIDGRVQSRQYVKKLSEEYAETRTAYEVSIWRLEVLSGEKCKDQVTDAE